MHYHQLTQEQRYTISVMLRQGFSQKVIAETLLVSASTISRELKRNRSRRGYSYEIAVENTAMRRERSVSCRCIAPWVRRRAIELLREDWSPEQISGYLALEDISISHQTIYAMIHEDKKNGGDLYMHCRHQLKHRSRPVGSASCRNIPNRVGIADRPAEADGSRFGDWEMDTIIGQDGKGAILTLVERSSNMLMMWHLPNGKRAMALSETVVRLLSPYKKWVRTITTDNGSEFACHEHISERLGCQVYFADPYSSWQKGCIEYHNKLIRQYIPKSSSFNEISDERIREIQYKINRRPRKKLNFQCPFKVFFKMLL